MSGSQKRWTQTAVALLAVAAAAPRVCPGESPKKPKEPQGPAIRLKLKDLGAPPLSAGFVNAGYSMLTVHLLDQTHLLLTFSTRQLVPRIPGDPPEDEDRIVEGQILELPEDVPLATCQRDRVATWDSLAQTTLIAALEDEFGIGFEIADYDKLDSYPGIVATLEAKVAGRPS